MVRRAGHVRDDAPRVHTGTRLPDPRAALREWGANACSMYDGAGFRGAAEVHDELAIGEACRHWFVDDA